MKKGRRIYNRVLVFLIPVLLMAACVSLIQHDQEKAGRSALKFSETAFTEKEFGTALKFVDKNSKLANEKYLQEFDLKIHPDSSPNVLRANYFAPISGQRAMKIYIIGKNGPESFFYELTMVGDSYIGYSVLEAKRISEDNFRSQDKKPLPNFQ